MWTRCYHMSTKPLAANLCWQVWIRALAAAAAASTTIAARCSKASLQLVGPAAFILQDATACLQDVCKTCGCARLYQDQQVTSESCRTVAKGAREKEKEGARV